MTEGESYPMQDEPERKSHAANILSNNLSLSNCTFLAISLSEIVKGTVLLTILCRQAEPVNFDLVKRFPDSLLFQ